MAWPNSLAAQRTAMLKAKIAPSGHSKRASIFFLASHILSSTNQGAWPLKTKQVELSDFCGTIAMARVTP
jgi:hypothetical protein